MKFNKLFRRSEKNNDNPVETRCIASLPKTENFRGILEKFEKFAGKYKNQIFALIFGGTSLAGLAQQDPNRPQNAVNVQVWHAVLDDEYAGDMATAESNINDQIKPTQSAFLVDTRLYDHAIIFKALLEHLPETTLSHTGSVQTDYNNFTDWIINNSGDLRHYWTWYNNSMGYEGASTGYTASGPSTGLTVTIQSGGFDSADTGPHEFAGAAGALSSTYAEGVSGVEYHKDISSVGGPTDAVYNDGKTLGYGNTGGAYLPLYSTPNQYNRGNPANGGDGFNHFTSFGTPFPSWVGYTEIDNEVQEGDGPNTTDGFVDYYNQFPDHLISETTYYNADNGQNENFADPVAPVLQVTNDTLKLTNSADYSLKIPNTYNNAYANQYYTEGDYYVCFYPQGNVANDQYSAKIPLKQLVDGVALSDLGLADGTYEVGIYEWWSNSINFSNVTTFVLDTTPPPNNPPETAASSVSTAEDTPYTFSISDFNYSDADGDSLQKIKPTSLPAHGTLTLNGNAVSANQEISAGNIGNLQFTPDANWNGDTTFEFSASDGTDWSTPDTMTIHVDAVNDAPETYPSSVSTAEDTPYTFSISDFNYSDADGDSLQKIKPTSLPQHGTLTLNGNAVSANQEISAGNIGNLQFTPDANWNGDTTFEFSASDGTDWSTPDTMTIHVDAVNDAPTLNDISINATVVNNTTLTYDFSQLDLSSYYNDVEGDQITDVRIATLPTNGTLQLNGNAISAGDEISATDFANLRYVSNAGNSDYTDDFEIAVKDGTDWSNNAHVSFNITVGIEDEKIAGIKLYPNPVRNFAKIESPVEVSDAIVYTMDGRIASIHGYDPDSGLLDISKLASGVYIVALFDKDNQVLKRVKVVKE